MGRTSCEQTFRSELKVTDIFLNDQNCTENSSDDKFGMVNLICRNGQISVHKVLLGAHSPFLLELFQCQKDCDISLTDFAVNAAEKFCRLVYQGYTVVTATEIQEVRKMAAVLACGMPKISDATDQEVQSSVKIRISSVDGQTQLQQVEHGHTQKVIERFPQVEADLARVRLTAPSDPAGIVNSPPPPVINSSTVTLTSLSASNFNEICNESNVEDTLRDIRGRFTSQTDKLPQARNSRGLFNRQTDKEPQARNNSTNLPSAMEMISGGKPMPKRMKIQAILNSSNSPLLARPPEPTQTNNHKAGNLLPATQASKTSNVSNSTTKAVAIAVTNAALKMNSTPIITVRTSTTLKASNSLTRSTTPVSILTGISEQISTVPKPPSTQQLAAEAEKTWTNPDQLLATATATPEQDPYKPKEGLGNWQWLLAGHDPDFHEEQQQYADTIKSRLSLPLSMKVIEKRNSDGTIYLSYYCENCNTNIEEFELAEVHNAHCDPQPPSNSTVTP